MPKPSKLTPAPRIARTKAPALHQLCRTLKVCKATDITKIGKPQIIGSAHFRGIGLHGGGRFSSPGVNLKPPLTPLAFGPVPTVSTAKVLA